jgi:hypothetical protein
MSKRLKCLRCGHKWMPRVDGQPVACPQCKSYKWNELAEPKLVEAPSEAAAVVAESQEK